jgi:hypothetical protein
MNCPYQYFLARSNIIKKSLPVKPMVANSLYWTTADLDAMPDDDLCDLAGFGRSLSRARGGNRHD